jgi:hypothetical protein
MFGRRTAQIFALGAFALATALVGCDAYDSSLLHGSFPTPVRDAGTHDGGQIDLDSGAAEDGGMEVCVPQPEICNGLDDDCDGKTDEETQAYCESVVVNAKTQCVPYNGGAACVKLGACLTGYDDCDGRPENGCEKPYCDCNDCGDAGEDTDAGQL